MHSEARSWRASTARAAVRSGSTRAHDAAGELWVAGRGWPVGSSSSKGPRSCRHQWPRRAGTLLGPASLVVRPVDGTGAPGHRRPASAELRPNSSCGSAKTTPLDHPSHIGGGRSDVVVRPDAQQVARTRTGQAQGSRPARRRPAPVRSPPPRRGESGGRPGRRHLTWGTRPTSRAGAEGVGAGDHPAPARWSARRPSGRRSRLGPAQACRRRCPAPGAAGATASSRRARRLSGYTGPGLRQAVAEVGHVAVARHAPD